jgi:hypothetical protein
VVEIHQPLVETYYGKTSMFSTFSFYFTMPWYLWYIFLNK